MSRFLLNRGAGIAITLLLLILAIVLFAHLVPGDVVGVRLGDQRVDPAARKQLQAQLGLNQSVPEAYGKYVWRALRGDLGHSLLSGRPVRSLIADRVPVTLELAAFALVV